MITVFNRALLWRTLSIGEQGRLRDLLRDHQIEYQLKTVSHANDGAGRGRLAGNATYDATAGIVYQFYVRKRDLAQASHLLNASK